MPSYLSVILLILFRVADQAGHPSAFRCMLNISYNATVITVQTQQSFNRTRWCWRITTSRVTTRVGYSSITGMGTKSPICSARLFKVDNEWILKDIISARSWVGIMRQQRTDKSCLHMSQPDWCNFSTVSGWSLCILIFELSLLVHLGSSVLAKRLAGDSIFKMTYFVSRWTKTFTQSINQSINQSIKVILRDTISFYPPNWNGVNLKHSI